MRFEEFHEALAKECPGVSSFNRLATSASVGIPFDQRAAARRCLDRLVRRDEIVLDEQARLLAVVHTSRRGASSAVRVQLDVPVPMLATGVVVVAQRVASHMGVPLRELLETPATSSGSPPFAFARLFDRTRRFLVDGRFASDLPFELSEVQTAGVLLADAAALTFASSASPYETTGLLVRALCEFPDIEEVASALDRRDPVRLAARPHPLTPAPRGAR